MMTLFLVIIILIETLIIAGLIIEFQEEKEEEKDNCQCKCHACCSDNHEICSVDCETLVWPGNA